jgi:DNA-binding LacI/PurR family transcriptional regulator
MGEHGGDIPERRPGLFDVARLAGVSHQTVSRVVNGQPNVRGATRERVQAAMQHLGYRPNPAARALVTGRSRALGVICFDTTLYGPAAALLGLEQAARDAGYSVNIVSVKTLDRRWVEDAIERLRAQMVAGIIVISPQAFLDDAFSALPAEIPTVAIWGPLNSSVPVIAIGEAEGAALATRHLLELGHRTVWHVAGPAGRIGAEERIRGWRSALRDAGIEPPRPLLGDWSARSGYVAGRLLARRRSATAVFVGNDQMALGVLRALHEAGRVVPDEVSVVGFDDIPEAAYFIPPLTTIRQDFTVLGRRSVSLVLGRIAGAGDAVAERLTLPTALVVRGSTARPAARTRAPR